VRIIAAISIDPDQALRSGRLRQDLYYRLNVLPLRIPPLRERKEDIPLLANYFLRKSASEALKVIDGFSFHALQKLLLHDWPENVRELERALQQAVSVCSGNIVEDHHIVLQEQEVDEDGTSFKEIKEKHVELFEKNYIERLLRTHHGNISRAAQAAKKHRRAFWQLMRKYGIDAEQFKSKKGA
jgi:two-component system, NtrC family, response regulator GlrR